MDGRLGLTLNDGVVERRWGQVWRFAAEDSVQHRAHGLSIGSRADCHSLRDAHVSRRLWNNHALVLGPRHRLGRAAIALVLVAVFVVGALVTTSPAYEADEGLLLAPIP